MSAGENDYLMRGNRFDVLRNVEGGGVEDKGVSFTLNLTPSAGAAGGTPGPSTGVGTFTPSKVT